MRYQSLAFLILLAAVRLGAAPGLLRDGPPQPGDFELVTGGRAAGILVDPDDFKVVSIAAHDLAMDIERVAGQKPAVQAGPGGLTPYTVFVGTLGRSRVIDALVSAGKLDVAALRGRWETFLIATVADPVPGVKQGLVITGSDRRGTAFGVFEVSQAIGVSPWYWWADVAPVRRPELRIAGGTRRFGPPSVQYRGIFLNDEDWGLQPWAAKTFAPEDGGIGPKTYAKIFELLLRLKANTLWPAMHKCTPPFNHFPEDAPLADDYAIVMGSSHAEPMLRNNVGEWTDPPQDYNYVTNRTGVLRYWEQRVAANGRYENIYTLGMRGIHDSSMIGPTTDADRVRVLGQIFTDQRALLAKHVDPKVERVPQMFCAYKEVLGLYRQGLRVPDDVTIVWPDDNFGYIRDFASATEQRRTGGFGVYYHVSYLGRPLSYLWLCTTPPALIWEEMSKAWDHGARRIWMLNVGDLKPAEIDTEFFLQMAWDINRWNRNNLADFLPEWAAREFGPASAPAIAEVMAGYYRLNFQRKPEQLQWWLPGEPPRASPFTSGEKDRRLEEFARLVGKSAAVQTALPPGSHDAFYELVAYPVRGSALANQRYFYGEQAALHGSDKGLAARALAADARLREETLYYNERLAGGKWRHLMALEPADDDWKSMRIAAWRLPHFESTSASADLPPVLSLPADRFTAKRDRAGAGWKSVPGLGISGGAMAVFPTTAPSVDLTRIASDAPRLDYAVTLPTGGDFGLQIHLVPVHPLAAGGQLRVAVAWDNDPPRLAGLEADDGGSGWAQGVLDADRIITVILPKVREGTHTLRVYGLDAGIVFDRLSLMPPAGAGP